MSKYNEDFPIFYTGTEGNTTKNKRVISNYRFPAVMKGQPVDVPAKELGTVVRRTYNGWYVLFDSDRLMREVRVFEGEVTFV